MTLPLPFFKDQLKIFFEKMQIDPTHLPWRLPLIPGKNEENSGIFDYLGYRGLEAGSLGFRLNWLIAKFGVMV